ncbi:MAG: FeoB-associated Cys-rich membrane protein [Verrucomicrobiota bacterium]
MNLDWQSLIALAVVLLAAAWLLRRLLRPQRAGCAGGCGCGGPPRPNQK